MTANSNVLGLDVGAARVGVAMAHAVARLPGPLVTLDNNAGIYDAILRIVREEEIGKIVVGLPRNLSGDDTPQTAQVRAFVEVLAGKTDIAVELQDEALTSVKAEEELHRRKQPYDKGAIDALAAVYILEDYLQSQETGAHRE